MGLGFARHLSFHLVFQNPIVGYLESSNPAITSLLPYSRIAEPAPSASSAEVPSPSGADAGAFLWMLHHGSAYVYQVLARNLPLSDLPTTQIVWPTRISRFSGCGWVPKDLRHRLALLAWETHFEDCFLRR